MDCLFTLLNVAMKKKGQPADNTKAPKPYHQKADDSLENESVGDVLDDNTSLDIFVSPTGYITELTDTRDEMDGARTEVIDIISEADGTNIELTIIEEPTDTPGVDSVDRFVQIKGIGPRVAELLTQAGIRQFSKLAETPVERLREILSAAGSHYRIYDPTTWPHQAKELVDSQLQAIDSSAARRL